MSTADNPDVELGFTEPVVVRNTAQPAEPTEPPRRADGRPWRFEMIFNDRRAYADSPEALVAALRPGYLEQDGPQRAKTRLQLACDTQVRLQAQLATAERLEKCTAQQRELLLGDFSTPPAVDRWDAPVELVLVRSFYEPDGSLPAPAGDALVWLDPGSDWDLLVSFAKNGVITVSESEAGPETAV